MFSAIEALQRSSDHARAILVGQRGAGGEAKALIEEAFADLAAVHLGPGEDGLEVHGLPDGAGFDVLSFQRETDLLTRDAREDGVDGQASEPAGRLSPRGFGLHSHTRQTLEGFGVGFEVPPATRDFAGEARELAKADAGRDVAEAVVIADGGMFVMRSRVAGLGGEETRLLGELGVIGDEHAATAGGDDLIAVEGMDAGEAEGTGRGFAIGRAKRFGGIFNQLHTMLVATGLDGGDVRRLAIEMDKDKRLGRLADLGFLFDDRAGERGIHVPAALFGIDEDGLGAEIGDGRGGRDEGQRGTQDFVARTDAGQAQREMQGGGAGRDGDGVLRADEPGEIFFKGVEIRSRRRDPIGLESFQDEFDFSAADIRRR